MIGNRNSLVLGAMAQVSITLTEDSKVVSMSQSHGFSLFGVLLIDLSLH